VFGKPRREKAGAARRASQPEGGKPGRRARHPANLDLFGDAADKS